MKKSLLILIPLFCFNLLLISCNNKQVSTPVVTSENQSPTAQTPQNINNLTNKVKFKLENGNEAFTLKPKEDGAKLEGANGKEIARLTKDQTGKIKIKDGNDKVLGYVVTKVGYWKLEDPSQKSELFILRLQNDGDYKLETGDNKEVYRIKKRDYGFEIESPNKQSLHKIKNKDGKISLRDSLDKNILSTKDQFLPIAMACFGFDLLTQSQQAGLAYALQLSGGK